MTCFFGMEGVTRSRTVGSDGRKCGELMQSQQESIGSEAGRYDGVSLHFVRFDRTPVLLSPELDPNCARQTEYFDFLHFLLFVFF